MRVNPGGGPWGQVNHNGSTIMSKVEGRPCWKSPFVPGSKGNHLWALESETNWSEGFWASSFGALVFSISGKRESQDSVLSCLFLTRCLCPEAQVVGDETER